MGKKSRFLLKALMGICALVLMVSLGISAEALDSDYHIGFPSDGVDDIKLPDRFPCFYRDYSDDAGWFLDKYGLTEKEIQDSVKETNSLVFIYPNNCDAVFSMYADEIDTPFFCDIWNEMTEEELHELYPYLQAATIECLPAKDGYCLNIEFFDETFNRYRHHVLFATKYRTTMNYKYYLFGFALDMYDLSLKDKYNEMLWDIIDNAKMNISTLENYDIQLPPVPKKMDFPEFGIYNVTIPDGFSVLTKDKIYATKEFYSNHSFEYDDLHQTFIDKPERVARIVNADFTYEIDIKAEPVPYGETVVSWDVYTEDLFGKLYPTTFYDEYEVFSCHRGYWGDKYCVGALSYDHLRDYYFHRVNFSNCIDDQYYLITYNLNGYHKDFDEGITKIYEDSVEDVQIENSLVPPTRKYKRNFLVRLLDLITGILK